MAEEKKRFVVNILGQISTFAIQLGISFLLTPFIVKKIGADSYGFIGLAENFVMYAQLLMVALNSMAGRFIAIAYHKGDLNTANKYFSSVILANSIMASLILLAGFLLVLFLENIIVIPSRLVLDVKFLFLLVIFNFLVSIVFSVYQVSTFIKNRLDLVAVRTIGANFIRALGLLALFCFFPPHLWYVSCMALVCTVYIILVNVKYTHRLTPELSFSKANYDFSSVKTLVSSGVWNTITKLGNTLAHGFDLLLTDLFVGAFAMGYLSIIKKIPTIILGLISSISGVFAPTLTQYYAQENKENFLKELLFSIRFIGFISVIPFGFLFVYAEDFYSLWLPGEDSIFFNELTVISLIPMVVGMAFEGVQNIFTITNKVKIYSYGTIFFNVMIFLTLVVGIHFFAPEERLYFLVINSSFWSLGRAFIFLPVYAAKCIKMSPWFLYHNLFKVILCLAIVILLLTGYKNIVGINGWLSFVWIGVVTILFSVVAGMATLLQCDEIHRIFGMIRNNK